MKALSCFRGERASEQANGQLLAAFQRAGEGIVCDLALIHQPAASRASLVLRNMNAAGRQTTAINQDEDEEGF